MLSTKQDLIKALENPDYTVGILAFMAILE